METGENILKDWTYNTNIKSKSPHIFLYQGKQITVGPFENGKIKFNHEKEDEKSDKRKVVIMYQFDKDLQKQADKILRSQK